MNTAATPAASRAAPVVSNERALAIDLAMLADKQARPGQPLVDGYEARRQAAAIRNESRFFNQGA